ncbi:hypothetical protein EKH55_4008 [Sinorhizobium alkalisoli]|nr:hypothetical protein EKH55_4008 [Sinorhizobium alkalisoli]
MRRRVRGPLRQAAIAFIPRNAAAKPCRRQSPGQDLKRACSSA